MKYLINLLSGILLIILGIIEIIYSNEIILGMLFLFFGLQVCLLVVKINQLSSNTTEANE